jgi:hypothetical protein
MAESFRESELPDNGWSRLASSPATVLKSILINPEI